MCESDEPTLVARSRRGDWEAYGELVRRNQRMIHAITYRMTGSAADSEDLAHEAFIRAYRALDSFRGEARFWSWLCRIAINLCIRWRRAESRRGETERRWAQAEALASGDTGQGERVQAALARLPAKQRAAVILTAIEGMSHAEAARALGCAEKTLSWRLFMARRRLATLLAPGRTAP